MKILITGGNGFLGQHLCMLLKDQFEIVATGRGIKQIPFENVAYVEADISSAHSMIKLLREVEPGVVIHAAAMSKPDECELQKDDCISINVNGTANIIDAVKAFNMAVHFIYISSDFVLGDDGPHGEDAIPRPLNFYGESKLLAESIVEASGLFYSIIRPVFMYGDIWGGMRSTFLHWVKENLEQGNPIKVVCDQFRTPTYVGDICTAVRTIFEQKVGGLYHLGGDEILTPYDMAVGLAHHLCLDPSLIEPVTAGTFSEPVLRAKKGGVLAGKAKKELRFAPKPYRVGLDIIFKTGLSKA